MKHTFNFPSPTRWRSTLWLLALVSCLATQAAPLKVVPTPGSIYHGTFPDLTSPSNIFFEGYKINRLESLLAKPMAWVQFQDDFVDGINFPWTAAQYIGNLSKIPYIRMLPRSHRRQISGADPIYNLRNILRGDFDRQFREYARQAKAFDFPLIIEFAPEANGQWYSWNGYWNGGGYTTAYGNPQLPDGPERYRDAYRRIINLFRAENVENVTWVFHVNSQSKPLTGWNTMAAYYPGDAYIDWIGVSVFGAQYPWEYWSTFTQVLDPVYNQLAAISTTKPLSIAEFGVIEDGRDPNRKANWIREALTSVRDGRYPRIQAVSYWSEHSWLPTGNNDLRIDSSAQSLRMYNSLIADPIFLGEAGVTWPAP